MRIVSGAVNTFGPRIAPAATPAGVAPYLYVPDIIDLSDVLDDWLSPYVIKTITRRTIDFVESPLVVQRTIMAMVQVADKEKLNTDTIDWSRRYILMHTHDSSVVIGERIVYRGVDYKIIDHYNWSDYGFMKFVGEEIK